MQSVDFNWLIESIETNQVHQIKQVGNNGQDWVLQIKDENEVSSTNFLNDDIQKTLEIINQIKSYNPNSFKIQEIEQQITLSLDGSQVQDIILVKPGKKSMKRSMKRYLKKRRMQKMVVPNMSDARQINTDLLIIQHDYIEVKISQEVLINNLLTQADSVFLVELETKQPLVEKKQKQEIMIDFKKVIEHLSNPKKPFAAKELSKMTIQALAEIIFLLFKSKKGFLQAKRANRLNIQEKQSVLMIKQLECFKQQSQNKQYFSNNVSQKNGKQTQQNRSYVTKFTEGFLGDQYYDGYNTFKNDLVNIQQQIISLNKLKTTKMQISISDQQISISLTQAQRNVLLNLIKNNKFAQIKRQITSIICKQSNLSKYNTLVLNKLSSQPKTSQFKDQKSNNQIKENDFIQDVCPSQTLSRKLSQSLNQLIPDFGASLSKILNLNKLLGGGCGSSKIGIAHPQNLKEDEKQKLKSDKYFEEDDRQTEGQFTKFIKIYNEYYTNNEIDHVVLENHIRFMVKALHKQCENIYQQAIRDKVIELINLLINYYMIAIQKNDIQSLQSLIDKTGKKLKDLRDTCFQKRKVNPCLDLCQYFELLICLNQQRQGIDKVNQSQAMKIAGIMLKLIKFGAGFTSIFGAIDTLSKISLEDIQKSMLEIKQSISKLFESSKEAGQQAVEQFTNYTNGNLVKNIQVVWIRKVEYLGENLRDEHQQLIFYLKEINEVHNKGNDEIVLFVYMQLNYLLQKKQNEDNLKSFTELLKDTQQESLVFDFINYLQFKTYSTNLFENSKKILDSLVVSERFRQIKISLLFKFSQILENFSNKKQEYRKLMIHLCMVYLQENEISVKIFFKGNQRMKVFIQNIEKYTTEIVNESKQSYQKMKSMIQNEEQLNKIANKIESKEDVSIMLAKTYVQMWEASVKQRQEQNKIAHKDDALLEVIQLYIKQRVTHQQGYSLFKKSNYQNEICSSSQKQDNQQESDKKNEEVQEEVDTKNEEDQQMFDDAIKLIVDNFLIPNFVQPNGRQLKLDQNTSQQESDKKNEEVQEEVDTKNEEDQQMFDDAIKLIVDNFLIPNFVQPNGRQLKLDQNTSDEQHCKILSILAEGGSGKSMLLKKLEVELLKDDSEYINDERAEYIPFIIKCNSLDIKNPSIEEYLLTQNLTQSELNLLKKSNRNKLILLDGYDEYTGDYFKVYQQLKIHSWVNTLVIVTSRLERISVSDARLYFNYYDQQGNLESTNSYSIIKLEKIKDQDILQYLKMYKEQQSQQPNFKLQQHDQLQDILFQSQNKSLLELLKLPINLYLTTRMVADLDLNDINTLTKFQEASDQVEIQELFFQQQFQKLSQSFIEEKFQIFTNNNKISESESNKQQLINVVQQCYFEYFQTIAMHMFLLKGKKKNFLCTKKSDIYFNQREEVQDYLNQNQINSEEVKNKVQSYIDSRVITRVKLSTKVENTQKQQNDEELEFEFRHKSLFEYFAARAMKHDVDLHKENIYKLDSSQLIEFNINKRIIMSNEKNGSEQQILLKLYQLIKTEINSPQFKQNYYLEDVSKTNKYIQFLKKSSISHNTQTSQIDVGASNLLSALFISKFSYPNLIFKKCSFSQAYIQKFSHNVVEFQDCNFEKAMLEQQYKEYFETSNTKQARFDFFQLQFDLNDVYSFQDILFYQNTLVTITKTGFINLFEILPNKSICYKKLLSNQITNSALKILRLVETKNLFVATTQKAIFEINAQTLEIINTFTFSYIISSLSINNSKYVVTLKNNSIFYGDIANGFQMLDSRKISSNYSISKDDLMITLNDGKIDVYNLQNLEKINTNFDHQCIIYEQSFSADGKYLVTFSQNKICQIWDVKNGFELMFAIEYAYSINTLAFSLDKKYLAISTSDLNLKIYQIEKTIELKKNIKTALEIRQLAFSSDNKYLVANQQYKICIIWDVEQGFKLINTVEGHTKEINSVAFSPNGKYLATGSTDKTCKIWNIEQEYELINIIKGHTGIIKSVAFSANGNYLATGSYDYTCKIWNVNNGFELVKEIEGHTDKIESIAFSADGKYLVTGSRDETCKIFNVQEYFKLIDTIHVHLNKIEQVVFSLDSKYLATVSSDATCRILKVEKGFETLKTIVCSYIYKSIEQSEEEEQDFYKNKIKLLNNRITQVAFSKDGKYFITGSEEKTCKVWNIDQGFELQYTIHVNAKEISQINISPNGKYLATRGGYNEMCQIWDVEKQFELLNNLDGNNPTFSADGTLLSIQFYQNFKVLNLEKRFEAIDQIQGHISEINMAAFSSDRKYLATGSCDNTCKIWNVNKGFELVCILKHNNQITAVAFSADGKYLATGSDDKTFKIWDIEKGFELIKTNHETSFKVIKQAAFSEDGKYFLAFSNNQYLFIYDFENQLNKINQIVCNSFAFFPDGQRLVVTVLNNLDIYSKKEEKGFELTTSIDIELVEYFYNIGFSSDGKYLFIISQKILQFRNVEKGYEIVYQLDYQNNDRSSYLQDGNFLAIADYKQDCKIYNLENLEEGLTFVGVLEFKNIISLEFSKDGKYLVTTSLSEYSTSKVWNVERVFELLKKICRQGNQTFSYAFSSDGKYLRTCFEKNSYEFWNAENFFEKVSASEIENSSITQLFLDKSLEDNNKSNLLKKMRNYQMFAQEFEI